MGHKSVWMERALGLLLFAAVVLPAVAAAYPSAPEYVDSWGATNAIVVWSDAQEREDDLAGFSAPLHRFWSIPAALVPADAVPALLEQTSHENEVEVWPATPIETFLESATEASRASHVWGSGGGGPIMLGDGRIIDGTGVGIAVIDAGIDTRHDALAGNTVRNFDVVSTFAHTPITQPGVFIPMESTENPYAGSHGTHVAGIAVGAGTDTGAPGAAPGASLYGFGTQTCVYTTCAVDSAALAAAMDWVVQHHDEQEPKIRVISISMGTIAPFDADHPIALLTEAAVDAGLAVVWAAGNEGGDGDTDNTNAYGKHPAPGVISVANYDDHEDGGREHGLSPSSSRGAVSDPASWPDLSAPGTQVRSAWGFSPWFTDLVLEPNTGLYQNMSGTSMAGPHLAGVAALVLQADPSLTPGDLERLFERTAFKFGSGYVPDPAHPGQEGSFDKGHGLVDARAAVEAVIHDGG